MSESVDGMRIIARAPSNIALIKYMGKKDEFANIPENPSLSLTLNSLCTWVEIAVQRQNDRQASWISELPRVGTGEYFEKYSNLRKSLHVPTLKEREIERVVRHVERVQTAVPNIFKSFGLKTAKDLQTLSFTLRTANTFPAASGIASSASSFAAVTLATVGACAEDFGALELAWKKEPGLRSRIAQLSRLGSGSSCRSFEGPWILWNGEEVETLPEAMSVPPVAHFVLLIQTDPKKVSSSHAHSLIRTSPLWEGRVERVTKRISQMRVALSQADFTALSRLAWMEAWEMHSLFHTCASPFSYWQPGTIDALHWFSQWMTKSSDPTLQPKGSPPIVTLDAGPNIHVIVEKDRRDEWRRLLKEQFVDYSILEDEEGHGAEWVLRNR